MCTADFLPHQGCLHDLRQETFERLSSRRVALPEGDHLPSVVLEPFAILNIAGTIAFDLRRPVRGVGFDGAPAIDAPRTSVPEAAMYEDAQFPAREYEIRAARQTAPMKAVAKACSVEKATHNQFGLCVPAPNPTHDLAATLG